MVGQSFKGGGAAHAGRLRTGITSRSRVGCRRSDSDAVGLKLCRQRDRDTGKKQGRNDEQRLEGHAHRDLMVLRAASPDHVETSAARHKVWVCKARLQAL